MSKRFGRNQKRKMRQQMDILENALKVSNELYEVAKNSFPNQERTSQDLLDLRLRGLSARGLANLELGKLAEAKTDLQEVVRVSPNSSAALVNLAKVAICFSRRR